MEVAEQVVPLIYTSEGNVPIDSLTYNKNWTVTDEMVVFSEGWFNKDGTLVKNNVHIYSLKSLDAAGEQYKG